MNTYNQRRLIHLRPESDWDPVVVIGFVDYTGHRAKHGGNHFIATHTARLTEEELFDLLSPYFNTGPGNEPDMAECDRCGKTFHSDELDWNYNTCELYCTNCLPIKEQT